MWLEFDGDYWRLTEVKYGMVIKGQGWACAWRCLRGSCWHGVEIQMVTYLVEIRRISQCLTQTQLGGWKCPKVVLQPKVVTQPKSTGRLGCNSIATQVVIPDLEVVDNQDRRGKF